VLELLHLTASRLLVWTTLAGNQRAAQQSSSIVFAWRSPMVVGCPDYALNFLDVQAFDA
jgi:hypothetical protein